MRQFAAVVPVDPETGPENSTVNPSASTEDVVWSRTSDLYFHDPACFFCLSTLNSSCSSALGVLVYQSSLEKNNGSALSLTCLTLAGFRLLLSVMMLLKRRELMITSSPAITNADRNWRHRQSKLSVALLLLLYIVLIVFIFWEHTVLQQQLIQPKTNGPQHPQLEFVWPAAAYWLIYLISLCGLIEITGAQMMCQGTSQLAHEKKVVLKHIKYTPPEPSDDPEMQNNSETQSTCTVCLDDFEPEETVAELACGHIFHRDCIRTWIETGGNCPFRCR